MLIEIVSHTPLWVWGLFAALLTLGLYQRRSRSVRPGQLLILPAVLLVLGLNSMAPAFMALPFAGVAWLAALAAGMALGLRLPRSSGTYWDTATQRLHLAGSWMPMLLIIAIFGLRYSAAVGMAFHPQWRTDPAVQLPLALCFGTLSGIFLGRARGLQRLATIKAHGSSAAA
jgi:hypothetical protein